MAVYELYDGSAEFAVTGDWVEIDSSALYAVAQTGYNNAAFLVQFSLDGVHAIELTYGANTTVFARSTSTATSEAQSWQVVNSPAKYARYKNYAGGAGQVAKSVLLAL